MNVYCLFLLSTFFSVGSVLVLPLPTCVWRVFTDIYKLYYRFFFLYNGIHNLAFKKQRRTRRKTRRTNKRRTRRANIPRAIVHNYARWTSNDVLKLPNIAIAAGATYASASYTFAFNNIAGFVDFYNLYDFYRIKAIKLRFTPFSNVTLAEGNSGLVFPDSFYSNRLITVIDYNDATLPPATAPGSDVLRQFKTAKMTYGNRQHTRYFKPRIRTNVFDTDGSAAYGQSMRNQWIAMDGAAQGDQHGCHVPYYGIKCVYQQELASTIGEDIYQVEAKIYFQCKNPK